MEKQKLIKNIKLKIAGALVALLSLSSAVPVLASVASPSQAEIEEQEYYDWFYGDDEEGEEDDSVLEFEDGDYTESYLRSIALEAVADSDIASASNASLVHIETLLTDIHAEIVPAAVEESEDVLEGEAVSSYSLMAASLSDDFSLDRNVVIYEGVWNGSECRLVLPVNKIGSMFVDASGNLYNVSSDTVTGRLFFGDFTPNDYEQYVFTLTPCLGSNSSTLYSYGSPNYCRYYYESSGRITYTTTYGDFAVTNVVRTASDSDSGMMCTYMLVLILIGGVILLCWFRKSKNS